MTRPCASMVMVAYQWRNIRAILSYKLFSLVKSTRVDKNDTTQLT